MSAGKVDPPKTELQGNTGKDGLLSETKENVYLMHFLILAKGYVVMSNNCISVSLTSHCAIIVDTTI